ncbi:unnamed protein product [Mytilus coruscus]|uniref:Uncharacterized protein n=1 Tax=Mytilus coruscus TaxID=42192 RepID=A0A6J8ECF4_MYTCO|nr:unnamed protein product [Mytilus coruscus]
MSSKRIKLNTPKKIINFSPRKIITNTEKQKKNNKEKLGSSIVFDNVNKHIKARSTDRKHGNTMKNIVQAYAAIDRIPLLHLCDKKPTSDQISKIPIESYLPDDNFRKSLRARSVRTLSHIPNTYRHINVKADVQHSFNEATELLRFATTKSIKDAGGNVTDTTIARHSEMVGVSKYLARLMSQVCNSAPQHHRTRGSVKREDDMIHLVDQLLKNSMCKKGGPMQHCGFNNIEHNNSTSHPVHMRKRIEKLLKKRVKRNNLLQLFVDG